MAKRLEIDFSQTQYSSYEDMIVQILMRTFKDNPDFIASDYHKPKPRIRNV